MRKTFIEEKFATIKIAIWFAICLAVAVLAPFLKYQVVVGTLVNAMLISAVLYLGLKPALLFAAIPSLMALSIGLLPIAAMAPFIIASNIIFICIFQKFKNGYQIKNYIKVSFLASLAKSAFLLASAYLLFGVLSSQAASSIAMTFGLMQLLTALMGSMLFYILFRPSSK